VTKKANKQLGKTGEDAKIATGKKSSNKRDGKKTASPKVKVVKTQKKLAAKSENKGKLEHKGGKQRRMALPGTAGKKSAGRRELDPFEVAKRTMKGSVPAVVKVLVDLAKQGSCTHAKTLLEMTGAKHMFDGEGLRENSGEPWAKLVLERLDKAEHKAEQSESAQVKALAAEAIVGQESGVGSFTSPEVGAAL
jgi:hypothetical protein